MSMCQGSMSAAAQTIRWNPKIQIVARSPLQANRRNALCNKKLLDRDRRVWLAWYSTSRRGQAFNQKRKTDLFKQICLMPRTAFLWQVVDENGSICYQCCVCLLA